MSRDALRQELAVPDDVVHELTDPEAADLLERYRSTRSAQKKALEESIEVTLRHLPRLVRLPARKILFG